MIDFQTSKNYIDTVLNQAQEKFSKLGYEQAGDPHFKYISPNISPDRAYQFYLSYYNKDDNYTSVVASSHELPLAGTKFLERVSEIDSLEQVLFKDRIRAVEELRDCVKDPELAKAIDALLDPIRTNLLTYMEDPNA